MVLEKTLESSLGCKEIQPVHSEGDQPRDFFGRNDLSFVCLFFLIVYLTMLGLHYGTRDFQSSWDLVPDQGLNPGLLHWEPGVSATGPPGKFLGNILSL